jgi:hypothetical protein
MHHVHLAKLLRVTLLAPDLVEAVLDGRLPKGVKLEDVVRPLPSAWAEQRRRDRRPASAFPGAALRTETASVRCTG